MLISLFHSSRDNGTKLSFLKRECFALLYMCMCEGRMMGVAGRIAVEVTVSEVYV